MSKSIVLCADGTWDGAYGEPASNVFKLFAALDGNLTVGKPGSPEQERRASDDEGVTQIAKYLHGVGDSGNFLDRLLGGSLGLGLLSRVLRGYTFVSRNYVPGDKIFVVGFSRGAYTARALAGLISGVGLLQWDALKLKKGQPDDAGYKYAASAWYDYQQRRLSDSPQAHNRWAIVKSFYTDLGDLLPALEEHRPKYFTGVPIEAVGVWDTVGSLGIPVLSPDHGTRLDAVRLIDTVLGVNIKHAFHAIAADEQRIDFSPTLWEADPRVVQCFFPGSHGDVGGGYLLGEDSSLSDVALVWMAEQLKALGMQFANDPPIASRGAALGPLHLPWTTAPYDVRPTGPRQFPAFTAEGNAITVDDSVRTRLGHPVPTVTATRPPVTHVAPYIPTALVRSGHLDLSDIKAKA
jgi:glutathione S-transferase